MYPDDDEDNEGRELTSKPRMTRTVALEHVERSGKNMAMFFDAGARAYVFTSICPACGEQMHKSTRSLLTKDLILTAFAIGTSLGEHLQRHKSFTEQLNELARQ